MSSKLKRRLKLSAGLVCALLLLMVLAWVFAPALLVVDSGSPPASSPPSTVQNPPLAIVVLGGEPWARPNRAAEVYQEIKAEMQKAETWSVVPLSASQHVSVSASQHVSVSASQHVSVSASQHVSISAFPTSPSDLPSPNSDLQPPPPISASQHVSVSAFPLVVVSGNGDCQDVRRQLVAKAVPASVIVTECDSRSTQENALFSVKLLRARGVTNVVIVTSWYHSRRALACFRSAAPEMRFASRPTPTEPQQSWWPNRYERKRITQEYAKIVYYWFVYGVSPWG